MSTAVWTSTIAVAVSSAVIAGAVLATSTAAVPATAIASPVPTGVSSIAGFCDSERTLKTGQDGVTKIEDHWTTHGNH
jgi:hypothetical protein